MQSSENYLIINKTLRLDPYYGDIENIYISNGWGSQYLKPTLQRMFDGCYYLIAIREKSAVGIARAFTDNVSISHLSEIVVEKRFHGMGVGEALMKVLIKDLGHTTIYADVLGSQSPSLFKKFGLQEKPKFTVYARKASCPGP